MDVVVAALFLPVLKGEVVILKVAIAASDIVKAFVYKFHSEVIWLFNNILVWFTPPQL